MRILSSEEISVNKYSLLRLCRELGTVELEDGKIRKLLRRYPRPNGGFYSKAHLRQVYEVLHDELKFSNREEQLFLRQTQKKATRSISGVTPVTVLTKPFPCPGRCIFCPNDVRMPKSYLSAEPGAQRAIRNNFDPYAQTYNRLLAFRNTGHSTDKIELIILGGTWTSYPEDYQRWFVTRCFQAMNDFKAETADAAYDPERDLPFSEGLLKEIRAGRVVEKDKQFVKTVKTVKVTPPSLPPSSSSGQALSGEELISGGSTGIATSHAPRNDDKTESEDKADGGSAGIAMSQVPRNDDKIESEVRGSSDGILNQVQDDTKALSPDYSNYNQVVSQALFPQREQAEKEVASWEELEQVQKINETADTRCVGMSIETRPDEITQEVVLELRRLGATKTQIGFQSLNDLVLEKNHRGHDVETTRKAVRLLRQGGFKIQAHWMPNLYGSTVEMDKADFVKMFEDGDFMPDELKVYPCSLIETAELMAYYEAGLWQPYTHDELLDVLTFCLQQTPEYTRLSRVVRDISSDDIVEGNKITNFRELAEKAVAESGGRVRDVRGREIRGKQVQVDALKRRDFVYQTSVSVEHFVQWETEEDQLAGFVRVSVPFAKLKRVYSTSARETEEVLKIVKETHPNLLYKQGRNKAGGDSAGIATSCSTCNPRNDGEVGVEADGDSAGIAASCSSCNPRNDGEVGVEAGGDSAGIAASCSTCNPRNDNELEASVEAGSDLDGIPDQVLDDGESVFHPDLEGAVIIRELHVYGPVVQLGEAKEGRAQHQGLGRQLLAKAEEIAREAGFEKLAVISAVGTREYYRKAGFVDGELYQVKML